MDQRCKKAPLFSLARRCTRRAERSTGAVLRPESSGKMSQNCCETADFGQFEYTAQNIRGSQTVVTAATGTQSSRPSEIKMNTLFGSI
ncbi:MAG TPA: hypothetical protein DDZ51_25040 [Planctomycetaceae bacterium]|nr:hypothetical protein [Planctomycetaceae bacterium]